jgi:hypothetical protein
MAAIFHSKQCGHHLFTMEAQIEQLKPYQQPIIMTHVCMGCKSLTSNDLGLEQHRAWLWLLAAVQKGNIGLNILDRLIFSLQHYFQVRKPFAMLSKGGS